MLKTQNVIFTMKKFFYVAVASFIALISFAFVKNGNQIKSDFQEGDVVFIESKSNQSPYIKVATMSKWTHCGLIVKTSKGLQVVEASNVSEFYKLS